MKARITRGKRFRDLVCYVTDREVKDAGRKNAEFICGTVLHGAIHEMVRDLMLPLKIKSVSKPVYHVSLSMPKGESP